MLNTKCAYRGMLVAPHFLASTAGLRVLQEGGNAIEAMVAAASTIAVVYPHMNGLGGDNFWLIHDQKNGMQGIDACGGAAYLATPEFYREHNCEQIPDRGPLAALTVAGAVSGWQSALEYSQHKLGGKLPLTRLLEDAVYYAKEGVAVTGTLASNAQSKLPELEGQPGFASIYLPDGKTLKINDRLVQATLSETLSHLAAKGLDDFYRGELAHSIATELEAVGSPVRRADLERHHALNIEPLTLNVAGHKVYNMPPPTQGLASLMLLGVYERLVKKLGVRQTDSVEFIHALVEATKCSFRIRDQYVTDPTYMSVDPADYLTSDALDKLAAQVDADKAAPWPDATGAGDTVWLGAMDKSGNSVSFIQSVYWEFGSGVILPSSGITWQNRGTSFSLDADHHNCLTPHRRPFHTIQPAMAELDDGRVMSFGTMGGEGQPQTQAMIFARHVLQGESLQSAITAPRWLLGRTWGSTATNLRMENRFAEPVFQRLRAAGHDVEVIGDFDEVMGHAGALVRHPDGLMEAGADPRSDGAACGF